MRIAFLTPGTGNYHCGVCMRDNSLSRHLIDHGHEVTMLPTYLPHLLDEKSAGTEDAPIFLMREFVEEGSKELPDPYGQNLEVYRACREDMKEAIPSLLNWVEKNL